MADEKKTAPEKLPEAMTAGELTHHVLRRAAHALGLAITIMEKYLGDDARPAPKSREPK